MLKLVAICPGVLSFAIALGGGTAVAREYSAVGAFPDSVEYLDPSTVKTDGDVKTFWTNIVYIRTNDLGIDWMSQYQSVNCATDRVITFNVIAYRMNGEVVGQTEGHASVQPHWIDIPPETEAAAVEDAVCHGNVLGTDSGASFLEVAPVARRRLIQIAAHHPQQGASMQQTTTPPPAWRSALRQLGRAMQQASAPPQVYAPNGTGIGRTVYSPSECVGPIVAGVCQGTILPNQATHPVCHGEMLNGTCTGPIF